MPEVRPHVVLLTYTPNVEEIVAMAAKLCYSRADVDTLKQGVARKDQAVFLQKLMDMGHASPIEHASFSFAVEGVSRALLAQITRHRIASFSVQSQRYVGQKRAEGTFNYIVPPAIARLGAEAVARYEGQMAQMQQWYNAWAEALGDAGESSNEDARFVLPNAAETKFVVTMNARELLHFFQLRCCNRAQWEIRGIAWQMLAACRQVAPALFGSAGPGCLRGACTEGPKCCGRMQEVRAFDAQLQAPEQEA
nr:FAD-dependent thymidylate synthase [Maliibacterium massiliense]